MKLLHIRQLTTLLLFSFFLFGCNAKYGKKITIDGTKGEIYYKGEGVTEADAIKLGQMLKKDGFLSSSKRASVQLVKEGEEYNVRFVYDKDYYEKTKGLDEIFKRYGNRFSQDLFAGKKVNVALADDQFRDFKNFPYDEKAGLYDKPPADDNTGNSNTGFVKSSYDHEKADGVDFFWKGISDEESKRIADYIIQNGAFRGGTAEIYMTMEDGRTVLRFPMKEFARNDPSYISQVDKVAREIKDNAFPDAPYSFIVTDEYLRTFKTWDY